MYVYYYDTIIGKIAIEADDDNITGLYFDDGSNGVILETDLIKNAYIQLIEYLDGRRKCFNLPLKYTGTVFQNKVWEELLNVSYGEVMCYEDIAIRIGNKKAVRAVGLANNKNKIPVFIPCHRVIGKDGSLVGYRGGLVVKKFLLDLEKNNR